MVRVGAVLGHDHVGLEVQHRGGDDLLDRPQVGAVAGVGRQRHVDRGALGRADAALGDAAGAREQVAAGLVDRARQHPRLLEEDPLGAVAVVDVDVDVGDALGAGVEQRLDRDGGVVVDAEARGAVGDRVVQAAAGDEGLVGPPLPHGHRPRHRRAADRGGRLVHARERRGVAARGEAPLAGLPGRGQRRVRRCSGAPPRRRPARGPARSSASVAGVGATGRTSGCSVEPVRPDQVDRELAPQRRHRVVVAEVVRGPALGVDERGRHGRNLSDRHPPSPGDAVSSALPAAARPQAVSRPARPPSTAGCGARSRGPRRRRGRRRRNAAISSSGTSPKTKRAPVGGSPSAPANSIAPAAIHSAIRARWASRCGAAALEDVGDVVVDEDGVGAGRHQRLPGEAQGVRAAAAPREHVDVVHAAPAARGRR